MSRPVLAGLIGKSPDWLKAVENGRLQMPRLPMLLASLREASRAFGEPGRAAPDQMPYRDDTVDGGRDGPSAAVSPVLSGWMRTRRTRRSSTSPSRCYMSPTG